MPLLKRKAIKPVPNPSSNEFDDDAPVWVMRFTNEIFTTYEYPTDYINRYLFYQQRTWQCITTGKSGLTYEEALESEHKAQSATASKFPSQLRKPLLEFVQFNIGRIDAVVEESIAQFKDRYYEGETVNVVWDKQKSYAGFIKRVLPKSEWITIEGSQDPEVPGQYLVQIVNESDKPIAGMEKIVDCSMLSRDRLAFNKMIVRTTIRECMSKENYMSAPWVVKNVWAKKYGIDTTLPASLQKARDLAQAKLKKRKGPGDPAPELSGAKKAKKDTPPGEEKKTVTPQEPVKVIKYPIEDLDLDVKLSKTEGDGKATLQRRPKGLTDLDVPQDCFEQVVMAWQFLNSFSESLKLSPFSIRDFEDSLLHAAVEPRSVLVAEYHSVLLNAIIDDRQKGISKPQLVTSTTNSGSGPGAFEREGSVASESSMGDDGDVSFDGGYQQRQHRPINERVALVGQGWDEQQIPSSRHGWEATLVGCVNELGTFETIPDVDRILNHLVPDESSTKDDVEFLFPTLSVQDKIRLLVFLIEVAAGTSGIRMYMEQCREQLKALRVETLELNKERKRLQAERAELEKKEGETARNATLEGIELEESLLAKESSEVEGENESVAASGRHESRQEKLKRMMREREIEESRRQLAIRKSKVLSAELKVKAEARKKLDDQERALDRKEEMIEQETKRYQIARVKPLGRDRFMNRYWYFDAMVSMPHATDRIYIQSPTFLDLEILRARTDRSRILRKLENEEADEGVYELLLQHEKQVREGLLAARAAEEQRRELEKKLKAEESEDDEELRYSLANWNSGRANGAGHRNEVHKEIDETIPVEYHQSKWSYYNEPEQVNLLLQWLSRKGERELALVDAITSRYDEIVGGMERRQYDLAVALQKEQSRRSTRTRTVQATEGYLGYINRTTK
ncbi:hypothetical protein DFQ27_006359 [Actinomortierella ambigua]|uniref:Uncharacterized protein n=1 Tax=Actinomortierella ambigua TaxID=1343610 RepID=A0A9P6QJC6_9FUNG|nr:hypothetical protein DFQ27_006359 [Actinomortierella ambigua]